jgi:hypothetical protein
VLLVNCWRTDGAAQSCDFFVWFVSSSSLSHFIPFLFASYVYYLLVVGQFALVSVLLSEEKSRKENESELCVRHHIAGLFEKETKFLLNKNQREKKKKKFFFFFCSVLSFSLFPLLQIRQCVFVCVCVCVCVLCAV